MFGTLDVGAPDTLAVYFMYDVKQYDPSETKATGIIIPLGSQSPDGTVELSLGAKGICELELVATGERWGRGPAKDVHSSLAAQVDSPAWHLVQALNTLVKADGHTPNVDGFFDKVRPLSTETRRGRRRSNGSSRSRRSTSRDSSAATPAPAARRSSRTARWRRSTCAS